MDSEWILNQANMRWGLTKKNKVGPVSELIRNCYPKTLQDWENYYYNNVYKKGYLEELGKRLYIKISEVCQAEIENEEALGVKIEPAPDAWDRGYEDIM